MKSTSFDRQTAHSRVFVLLVLGSLCGCDETRLELPPEEPDSGSDESDSGFTTDGNPITTPEPVPCMGAAEGEACGDDRHCIKQRCVFNTCGDGVQAGSEECDDGNQAPGDMCSPACKATVASCGDGRVDQGEECDDGNSVAADTCSTSCTRNVCGNTRVDPGEECDDGNKVDTDSCSNRCLRHLCRNGVIDPGEECDDGNTNPNDGCTNACEKIVCGDGMPGQQEECDDGNRIDTDGCSNACTGNVCGNGRVDPNEVCDGALTKTGMVPMGSRCQTCTAISEDRCGECEVVECREQFQELEFDWYKYCYEETSPFGSLSGWVQKCTALANCIKYSRCDLLDPVKPLATCYCGATTSLDDCGDGKGISGPCIKEFEAATDAAPGDFKRVLDNITATDLPSGVVFGLALCHRDVCAEKCRN